MVTPQDLGVCTQPSEAKAEALYIRVPHASPSVSPFIAMTREYPSGSKASAIPALAPVEVRYASPTCTGVVL